MVLSTCFRSPIDPELKLIKRIVGLPDDLVKTLPPYKEKIAFTPEGHLWVEGDESFHSKDSNTFGPVGVRKDLYSLLIYILCVLGFNGPTRGESEIRLVATLPLWPCGPCPAIQAKTYIAQSVKSSD